MAGSHHAAHNLEQTRFSRPGPSHQACYLTALQLKNYIMQDSPGHGGSRQIGQAYANQFEGHSESATSLEQNGLRGTGKPFSSNSRTNWKSPGTRNPCLHINSVRE